MSHTILLIFRFGTPEPTRGRQTLCKYYHDNEILNEQLPRIKAAQTVNDFEQLLQEQLRRNQVFPKSAKSIEPYYDFEEILRNRTCLSEKSVLQYRFVSKQLLNENRETSSTLSLGNHPFTSAPRRQNEKVRNIENFTYVAAECYEKCISVYLNDLSSFERQVERERQSILSHIDHSIPLSLRQVFDDSSLINQINRIKISFKSPQSNPPKLKSPRQSIHIPRVCLQTMSSNDSNKNRDESTNQVKDPPEIVLSDHSTNQNNIPGDITENFSDTAQSIDKSCYLSVPIGNCYSSEARPP